MSELSVHAGYDGGLGVATEPSPGTAVTPPTTWLEIESETFDEERNWIDTPGIDGTRSRSKHRSAQTTIDPKGSFRLNGVKGADLDKILELLLGNYGSGTGYVGDTLPSFTVCVHKPPKYDVYAGCKMASGTFESAEGDQALKFDAEVTARTLTEGTITDFGTASYADEIPLIHRRLTFTVESEAVNIKRWQLKVENPLDTETFRNSQTRLALPENGERVVGGEFTPDWNATNYTNVMDLWRAGTYGEMRAEYTNGVYVVTFVCANCRFPTERGKVSGKEAIEMPSKFEARSSGPGEQDELQVYVAAA